MAYKGSTLKNLAFSLIVFSSFLLFLEIFFRVTHLFGAATSFTQCDSLIGYRFIPSAYYWSHLENDHAVSGKINSHGWRDKERTLDKSAGSIRVANLGDSFVEALQVEEDSTFLQIAERALNKKSGVNFEMMNFGRSGFTQTEELIILERDVVKFKPDIVVIYFLPSNDIMDVRPETDQSHLRPYFKTSHSGKLQLDLSYLQNSKYRFQCFINFIKRNSAIANMMVQKYIKAREVRDLEAEKKDSIQEPFKGTYLSLATNSPDVKMQTSYQLNKILLAEMVGLCKQNDILPLIVCNNSYGYRPDHENKLKLADNSFNAFFFEKDMAKFCDSLGIAYLGLQSKFRQHFEQNERELHWSVWNHNGWSHWDYEGHRLVAGLVSEKIREMSDN